METLKKIGKYIFIGICIIAAAFLLNTCNGVLKSCQGPDHKTTLDTIKIHTRDTIWARDTIVQLIPSKSSRPVVIHDTFWKPLPIDSLDLMRFYITKDSSEDKNIKIWDVSYTQGKTFKGHKSSYKLKVPLVIYDTTKITVTKHDSIRYLPKYQVATGIIAGYKETTPILYFTKGRQEVGLGYNLQSGNNYLEGARVSYKYTIWRSKK